MLETGVTSSVLSLEHERFRNAFGSAVELLSTKGIDYRVIGSLALHGNIPDLVFKPEVTNKSWRSPYRDIDIVFPEYEYRRRRKEIQETIEGFNREHEPVFMDDTFSRRGWLAWGEASYLSYYHYKISIPSQVFEPHNTELLGVKFITVPPPTLFHIGGVVGELRQEDRQALFVLGRWLRNNPFPRYPKHLYEGFHRFYKGKLMRYPFHALWLHRRHLKESDTTDSIGRAYTRFPESLKALQREVSKLCLLVEGEIVRW